MNKPKIIATFTPQAWVDDHAVEVDPEGETEFDITDVLLSRLPGRMSADYEFTEEFQQFGPKWIQEWQGPFYIEISESLEEYIDEQAALIAKLEAEIAALKCSTATHNYVAHLHGGNVVDRRMQRLSDAPDQLLKEVERYVEENKLETQKGDELLHVAFTTNASGAITQAYLQQIDLDDFR